METTYDEIIVGAGIMGLAHAYHLAQNGRRVMVIERDRRPLGASVRNFGMLWPIGQPPGPLYELARRSLDLWGEVLQETRLWRERAGSLHLAYREDEARVLSEFVERSSAYGIECELLDPGSAADRSPLLKTEGLLAALWSPTETCVDPREVLGRLPVWLNERFGVRFECGTAVTEYRDGRVRAGARSWNTDHLTLCSGDDLETLFPELLREVGFSRCKLQMMRTAPLNGIPRIGPMLAGGLTLRHYRSFEVCPSLPPLKARIAAETSDYDRYGIHVLAAQNGRNEIVLGDSHEYDEAIGPFDKAEIDRLILDYVRGFLRIEKATIAERWHGTYVKHPTRPYFYHRPSSDLTIVTGLGGAGMTLSFGLAERGVRERLMPSSNSP